MMSSKGAATVSCPGFSSGAGGAFLSPTLAFSSGIAPFPLARLGAYAEAVPSVATSAARYELSEGIFFALHVVPELEFVDVQRQIGFGNLVEGADDAALQQAPKTFNRLRVDGADNVLLVCVPDDLMRVFGGETAIAYPLVCDQQRHLVGYDLAHEAFEGRRVNAIDDAGNDLA